MLKLTETQGDAIRSAARDLKAAGFRNVVTKLHPAIKRVGPSNDATQQQLWPHLRVAITFDVPAEAIAFLGMDVTSSPSSRSQAKEDQE